MHRNYTTFKIGWSQLRSEKKQSKTKPHNMMSITWGTELQPRSGHKGLGKNINQVYLTKLQESKDRSEQRLVWWPVIEEQGVTEKQEVLAQKAKFWKRDKVSPHSKIKDKPRTLTVSNKEVSPCTTFWPRFLTRETLCLPGCVRKCSPGMSLHMMAVMQMSSDKWLRNTEVESLSLVITESRELPLMAFMCLAFPISSKWILAKSTRPLQIKLSAVRESAKTWI